MLALRGSAWHQLPCHQPRRPHAPPAPPLRAQQQPQDHDTGTLEPVATSATPKAAPANAGQPQAERTRRLPLGEPTPAGPLPPLEQCRHFVNLTNGIEALSTLQALELQHSYVRLESTACEQGHLEALLLGLDANLLMSVALGHCCLVWDLGSRNKTFAVPRALWYGLEFVRYVLYRKWLGRNPRVHLRGRVVSGEFESRMQAMRSSTFTRLRYFKRWLQVEDLRLHGVYRATGNELVPGFYQNILDASGVRAGAWSDGGLEGNPASSSGSRDQQGVQCLDVSGVGTPAPPQLLLPARPGVGQVSFGLKGGTRTPGQQALLQRGSSDGHMVDSEQRLLDVGYQVHYRGLSPQEWGQLTAQVAAGRAAGEHQD